MRNSSATRPICKVAAGLGSGLLLATGCTVYAPMQPLAPLIRARGQAEASFQTQGLIRPEGSVAYSPASHLLVAASGMWRPQLPFSQDGKPDGFRVAQLEAGVGTYWLLGPRWLGTATIGAGVAQSRRTVTELGFLYTFSNDYAARYHTHFGQLNLAYLGKDLLVGGGYRLTRVRFTELSAASATGTAYMLPLDDQLRHEPFAFMRYRLGKPAVPSRWQMQVSAAWSFCRPGRTGPPQPYDETAFRAQYNRGGVLLLGFGVVYSLTKDNKY